MTNVHIVTSVKGGVGKTLLCIATMSSYIVRDVNGRSILGIDLNSMNTDLFRSLATDHNPKRLKGASNWIKSKIRDGHPSTVVRRNEPYVLLNGAAEFWGQLSELLNHDEFSDCDFIVDTNLHLTNLITGSTEPHNYLNTILDENEDRIIHIWILWTFASLRYPDDIVKGLTFFTNRISKQFSNRVRFVHVLNPSALVPPHVDLNTHIEAWYAYKQTEDRLAETNLLLSDTRLKEALERARREYLNILHEALQEKLSTPPEPIPYPFQGLKKLIQETTVNSIAYEEFMRKIGHLIADQVLRRPVENIFDEIYEQSFKDRGRPQNLLPISTHDPSMRGYTEVIDYETRTFDDIYNRVKNIEDDVWTFLQGLR